MAKTRPHKGRRRGRTPKLTPDVQKIILDTIAAGVPEKFAAGRAGISERTLRLWKARGAGDRGGPFCAFLAAFKKAACDSVSARVARITRAAQGGQVVERVTKTVTDRTGKTTTTTTEKMTRPEWTADAWILERTHDDEFANHKRELAELRKEQAAIRKLIEANSGEDGPAIPPGERKDPSAVG